MEIFLSAVLGELVSRSINLFISRSSKPAVLGMEDSARPAIRTRQCPSGLGSSEPSTKFEVLAWRSQVLPHYSYIISCGTQELKTRATKRKCSIRNSGTNNFA